MAERYFGIDRGEQGIPNVTEDSSTTATTDVEVRVDLAPGMSKTEVLMAIETIKHYIIGLNWPPA